MYQVIRAAYRHRGFAFVRILQRCPHFMPGYFDTLLSNPDRLMVLESDEMSLGEASARVYKNRQQYDASDIHRAREIAESEDQVPVGILYRDETVPCYEDLRKPQRVHLAQQTEAVLDKAFDRFGIFPRMPPDAPRRVPR